jgi:ABC-type nitrate/sulfonate/bicarbonate transport system substrate-binding protein
MDANVAAMKSGAVDGFVMGVEAGYLLSDQDSGRLLVRFDSIVPRFVSHAMFATDAVIKRDPDAVRRFVAGWFDAVAWMETHKTETVKIASDASKLPLDVMSRTYDDVMPTMSRTGRFDPEALKILAQSFVELGMLPTVIDPAAEIDSSFLPAGK